MADSTTIRVHSETRDRINRLARARGVSAPQLIGQLVERAEDDELFAQHAAAYDELRRRAPELLLEIVHEDSAWEASDLAAPRRDG
ncbi:hypothetical protein BH20ACT16_BH20ACT16_13800 [soil metagenome]|jgi:hypothetical protein